MASTAHAVCGPRDQIVAALKGTKWKEAQVGVGVSLRGTVLELWASAGGKTWTIVETDRNGRSCIRTGGKDWQDLKKPKGAVY